MPAKTDNMIQISGGRAVGFAEYGDLSGRPVILLHGLPSSRLELNNPELIAAAERQHVRLILPERPGIGLTQYQSYTITDYPDLVAEFAGKLGFSRFPVVGFSSGGKFALACAWKMPGVLTSVTVVSGCAPLDLPGVSETLSNQDRQVYRLADRWPWLFRLVLWNIARRVRRNPHMILSLFTEMSLEDKTILSAPDAANTLGQMVIEAFHQGTRGAAQDWQLEARPWGFKLSDISMMVHIWHGAQDRLVSPEQARLMAEVIPDARLNVYQGEGHTLLATHLEELLQTTAC